MASSPVEGEIRCFFRDAAGSLDSCQVGTTFFGTGMKTPFLVLWPLLSFPNLLAY